MFPCIEEKYVYFSHPFTSLCVGPTMSGKTYLAKLIKHRDEMIIPNVQRVLYSYKKWQPIFNTMNDVTFVQGMNFELDRNIPTLLIIDDQMNQVDERLAELFTVSAHHENTSVIFVTQNLFFQDFTEQLV